MPLNFIPNNFSLYVLIVQGKRSALNNTRFRPISETILSLLFHDILIGYPTWLGDINEHAKSVLQTRPNASTYFCDFLTFRFGASRQVDHLSVTA
jgi:hypothetical protein